MKSTRQLTVSLSTMLTSILDSGVTMSNETVRYPLNAPAHAPRRGAPASESPPGS